MIFKSKGFTLVELLVVVGVLAVLATAVVLVLNPAEYLKQSRDSIRVSDLQNINRALNLFNVANDSGFGNTNTVYVSLTASNSNCSDLNLPASPKPYHCVTIAGDLRKINGSGWMPVNFASLPQGSPFASLPVDPINTALSGHYYTYVVGSWELTAKMESGKYGPNGANDVVTTDGGDGAGRLEVGTNLTLTPSVIDGSGGGVPPENTVPGAPTNLAALPGDALASLSWTAPGSSGGQPIDYYIVYRSTDNISFAAVTGGSPCANPTGTACEDTGLTNGQIYYYKVSAHNINGEGGQSSSASTTPTQGLGERYWVSGVTCNGNWSDIDCWSTTSGGLGGASLPTTVAKVYVNSLSGLNPSINIDVAASAKDIDFTGANNPTLSGTENLNIAGSLKFISSLTLNYTGVINFAGRTTGNTITSAGKTFAGLIVFSGEGGGWRLADNLASSTQILLQNGTLNTVDPGGVSRNLQASSLFASAGGNVSLSLGGSSVTITGSSGQVWDMHASNTLDAGTSTITFSGDSAWAYLGGKTYNTVVFSGTGTAKIFGANTFANLTINNPPKTVNFEAGKKQTVTGAFTVSGTVGNLINLRSETDGSEWQIESTGSESVTRATIKDSNASPPISCSPASTCTNSGGNTGWSY